MGVELSPGPHEVSFRYEVKELATAHGMAIGSLGVIALLLIIAFAVKRENDGLS
jgi:hypothetical protein